MSVQANQLLSCFQLHSELSSFLRISSQIQNQSFYLEGSRVFLPEVSAGWRTWREGRSIQVHSSLWLAWVYALYLRLSSCLNVILIFVCFLFCACSHFERIELSFFGMWGNPLFVGIYQHSFFLIFAFVIQVLNEVIYFLKIDYFLFYPIFLIMNQVDYMFIIDSFLKDNETYFILYPFKLYIY